MARYLAVCVALLAVALLSCATGNIIVNSNTNECMNLPYHGYPEDGIQVHILNCRGADNQNWAFTKTGQIIGIGGNCLDVQGSQPVDGSRIIVVACNGRPSQNWGMTNPQGSPIVGIGGKCVDILGGNPADHAPLILAPCNGAPSQVWSLH
jgi:serine protease